MKNVEISNLPLLFVFVQTCLAQADFAPSFYDNGPSSNNGNLALFSLSEDTPVGTQIYQLNGTDPEGQEVRYGLSFDPGSKEYFRVDPKSGNITLVETMDREKQDSVDVNISITDGRSKVVERVTIFVTDANDEKPEFQNMPAIIDVLETTESGRSIYKVEAVDRDTGSGGSVTYHLQSPHSSLFAIDINSGVLRIKSGKTLDYEKTKTHFVTVIAKDGGGNLNDKEQFMSSTATLTVNVIDAQDTPPFFIGTPYFGYVYEISVPGSKIFTVSAEDGDVGNPNPVSYSFEEGDDGVFGINKTSGCISLLVAPIHLKREIFNIKVRATEISPEAKDLDYGVTTVVIRVVDLNNNPPTFYGENGPQNMFELTMYEHPPEGEILRGLKITVNDSDKGANAKFNLRLIGPGRMLRAVPQTVLNEAQVTILVEDSAAMDYEKHHFLTYKLLAVEIDTPERFSATAHIVIHLLDTNDNAPKFSSDYYIARIPENSPGGSNVVSVTALDPDSGPWGEVKYSIYGSGAEMFLIQPTSGIIYTQPWASLDAEVRSKYNFYVKAEDAEGKYSLAEVFVTVLDLNDHPPAFNNNFLEKTMVIGAPVKIEAVDDDAEIPNNVIEYAIMKAEPDNNIFDIDADTGEIKLKSYIKSMAIIQNITKKTDCSWSLVVQARDRGQPSFSTTAVVKIDITEATQLKGGPLGSFIELNRNNSLQIIGMLVGIISLVVIVTVIISTATFLRNKKSNRILPTRRVRRRPPKQPFWNFKSPFKSSETPREDFTVQEEQQEPEVNVMNANYNNNFSTVVRHWPPPPCAPSLPPPPPTYVPGERHWTVPTVSAVVVPKPRQRPKIDRRDTVNKALVSELKMRLEQKKMASLYNT
ncbi:cadherin-related family member 1a isoform X1 [Poecilia reticulata]|uniref:cadherin-related family member 1a isoform X1 n=1 Tax=Poecilia reticulata TaxID=8081 RepID=UPI0004A37FDD|nr:PREDICTED: cadherin-related family member 1-like isoform X1 [Poecilia reticulata]